MSQLSVTRPISQQIGSDPVPQFGKSNKILSKLLSFITPYPSFAAKVKKIARAIFPCLSAQLLERPLSLDRAWIVKKLENGLTYYVRRNAHPFPNKASLRLVIRAGSLDEKPEEMGIAHLIEHIAQLETVKFPQGEITQYLNSKGVHWALDNNAYTTPKETVYKLDIPADMETVDKCVNILGEVAGSALLSDKAIDRERAIIVDELCQRDTLMANYQGAKNAILCAGTPYEALPGVQQVIRSVKECSYDAVRAFYNRCYKPAKMAVIAVGDFDPQKVDNLIQKVFGTLSRREASLPSPTYEIAPADRPRYLRYSHPEFTHTFAELHFIPQMRVLGSTVEDKRYELERTLFGVMLNNRLTDIESGEAADFLEADFRREEMFEGHHVHKAIAILREAKVYEGLKQLLLEIKRVRKHGFLPSEFERAKRSVLANIESRMREQGKVTTNKYLSLCHKHFVDHVPLEDIDEANRQNRLLLQRLTLAAVNRRAEEFLPDQGRFLSLASPVKKELESVTEEMMARVMKEVDQLNVDPLQEIPEESLMKIDKAPGEVVSIKHHPLSDVTEILLGNGMRVFHKHTTTAKDEVRIQALAVGGLIDCDPENRPSAQFVEDFSSECGLGNLDHVALNRRFAGKRISVNSSIGQYITTINILCPPKEIGTSAELMHLLFTHPRHTKEAFHRALEKTREVLLNEKNDPLALLSRELLGTIHQKHPQMQPLALEDLDHVDYDACIDFYRERYGNPADFAVAIVGNVTRKEVVDMAKTYLASIPNQVGERKNKELPTIPFPEGIIRKEVSTEKKEGVTTFVLFPAVISDARSDRLLSTWVCELLERRLNKVLRFDMGSTYMQDCSFSHTDVPGLNQKIPPKAIVTLTSDSAHRDAVEAAMFEQVKDLRENGPTDEEVEEFKVWFKRAKTESLHTNKGWLNSIVYSVLFRYDLDRINDWEPLLTAFTPEIARQWISKIFKQDNYVVLTNK